MHNLAIALHKKGYTVTGSDDEVFEPARSRLKSYGLLPESEGWFPEKIDQTTDAVILGMHAKADNPEMIRAKELGVKIYSYPEYLYQMSRDKLRIVVGGSHGKTTVTAMILHAMKSLGIETDYMVGAKLEGFDVMVKSDETSRYMVLEGDEYLSSTLDPRPKFHLYKPDIAIINGIAWDHINVFPTFENYVEQFQIFADKIEPNGKLIYYADDENVASIAAKARKDIELLPYYGLESVVREGKTIVREGGKEYELLVFGKHNLINLNAAMLALESIGVKRDEFLDAMRSFKGAAKRLELLANSTDKAFFTDFAHSPSKLKATIQAVKEQFPDRKLVAVMELHTFSSLSADFLKEYSHAMDAADVAAVFFSPHAIELKRLAKLQNEDIISTFGRSDLAVFSTKEEVERFVRENAHSDTNILMMSSGNFDGIDQKRLAQEVIK